MIRRRSFSPMQRPAVWTAGTLFVLCGSLLCSEFVRSEETPAKPSAFATVSSKSAPDNLGQATIADRPTGWASLGDDSTGSATIDDEPEWQSSDSMRSKQRESAAADSSWAVMPDESQGQVSTREATPGRVAVFDEHPEAVRVSRDGRSPTTTGDAQTAPAKLDPSQDSLPEIVVTPHRRHVPQALPARLDTTRSEDHGRLPVISSLNDRTVKETATTGPSAVTNLFANEATSKIASKTTQQDDKRKPVVPSITGETTLPKETEEPAPTSLASEPDSEPETSVTDLSESLNPASDQAACCDDKSCSDEQSCCDEETVADTQTAENSETEDAASQPGWVTLDLSGDTGKASIEDSPVATSSASLGGEDFDVEQRIGSAPPVEGWRPHSNATRVKFVPTAAAPNLPPVEIGEDHDSFPVPPRQSDSVMIHLSSAKASVPDERNAVQTLSDGPALAAPVAPRVSVGAIAVSTLLSDDTGRRKGSDLGTTRVMSPRRVSLFDADDPLAFDPPPTPDGTEPPEPGNDEPVDLEPLLAPSMNPGDDPALAGPQLSGPGDANQKTANPDEQKLGEAPEDTSLRFLRQQTVLLKPGEMQFDVSIQYLNDKIDFVGVQQINGNVQIAEAERRQRLVMVPLQLRVGVFDYTQAFVNVPFGWSNSEAEFLGQDSAKSSGGIGDVSAGILKQIVVGNEFYPDVLASISVTAPTGESSFLTALTTPGSNLGEGFWSVTTAITFIQSYDPIVLFYGGGYRHRFQEKFNGTTKVTPGSQFIYRFGVGFAVNPNVTLSAAFNGSYIGELEVNGTNVGGSTQEPMQVRLAATINKRKVSKTHSSVKLVEPFVTFGLNDDAIDTIIGVTWTF